VRRVLIAAIASLLVAGLFAPAVAGAQATGSGGAVPKVVIIVGPAGGATNRYRAEARAAAAIARDYTPDVTELYSPNATWPAVKEALQGASLVLYMGHGNGWPSRYRDSLYPATQDGFGLNPTAGGSDASHQYFGEGPIADDIRLATNAVVLLNHLCYASGNSEPGLAEGTLGEARQRVDNFAAGFIKAGAAAVVAEAYGNPNHMVRVVLGGKRSIEAAWRTAPTANNRSFAFESVRSQGYVAQMDPERRSSGFSRSIVLKAGLASADVLRNARGTIHATASAPIDAAALDPSLGGTGITLAAPVIQGSTAVDGRIRYKIPFKIADRDRLPTSIQASVRWDLLEAAPVDAKATDPAPPSGDAGPAPDFGLVTPEQVGDVIAPAALKIGKNAMAINLATPSVRGRYRLTIMLHDAEGVAYDSATQALVPALLVRVTGDLDGGIDAPAFLDLAPGSTTNLPVWVANLGRTAWGHPAIEDARDPDGGDPAAAAHITGTWVALGAQDDPDQQAAADAASVDTVTLPAGFEPRAVVGPKLRLFAPSVAGQYLLVLDIVTPEAGSLTARGIEPAIIRVNVAEPAAVPSGTPVTEPAEPGGGATEPGAADSSTPAADST
jgi:hypothetical protein